MIRTFTAAAVLMIGAAALQPATASAQEGLLPALGAVIDAERNRKSEQEIQREAGRRALNETVQNGEVSGEGLVRGFLTYQEEKRRIEEEERRKREESRERAIRALLGIAGGN